MAHPSRAGFTSLSHLPKRFLVEGVCHSTIIVGSLRIVAYMQLNSNPFSEALYPERHSKRDMHFSPSEVA